MGFPFVHSIVNRNCLLVLGLALASLLVSCASTKIHFVDEGALGGLKGAGHVALAGVLGTGSAIGIHPEERADIACDLERRLKKKRRHLAVSTPILFESIVGCPRLRSGGDRTSISDFLTPSQRAKLRESRFDYVMILVLSANETWCDVDESESTEDENEYDQHGNVIACRTTTTYTTTSRAHRRAAGHFYLFDAGTGNQVWKAESRHSESNNRSSSSTFSHPNPPPHPEPPGLVDVVENMNQSIARKFPK